VVLVASKYKYENRKYKVITPYDAQRDGIEKALKKEGLEWKDTVFNVDSFQGEKYLSFGLGRSEHTWGVFFFPQEMKKIT
jgi:hypothetical protein